MVLYRVYCTVYETEHENSKSCWKHIRAKKYRAVLLPLLLLVSLISRGLSHSHRCCPSVTMMASVLPMVRRKTTELMEDWQALVEYLELPSRSEYWSALSVATNDVIQSTKSVYHLGFLTARPFLLLFWLLSQQLYIVVRFLGKQLFAGFYVSCQKGWAQFQWAARVGWQWQCRRTQQELIVEASVVLTVAVLYLLRRHIQQQKYVERVRSHYKRQRRRALKVRTSYMNTMCVCVRAYH